MTRILSASVLAAAVVAILVWMPAWATVVAAAIVAALAAFEIAGLAARAGASVPGLFVGLSGGLVAIAFALFDAGTAGASHAQPLAALLLALVVVTGALALAAGPPSATTLTRAAVMMMAPIYAGLPMGAIAVVRTAFGPGAALWLLGTVVVSDSAQYYTGRSLGRLRLAPAVSPAKTVEGAIGGVMAAGVVGLVVGPRVMPSMSAAAGGAVAAVLALFGIAGDLFESLLKRSVGAKDSSALIPGHGGVLDRIDAQLFAAPVFYLFLRYVV
jgi:phosphatidate cytidylyltransferase